MLLSSKNRRECIHPRARNSMHLAEDLRIISFGCGRRTLPCRLGLLSGERLILKGGAIPGGKVVLVSTSGSGYIRRLPALWIGNS